MLDRPFRISTMAAGVAVGLAAVMTIGADARARAPKTRLPVIAVTTLGDSPLLQRTARKIRRQLARLGVTAPTPAERQLARRMTRCEGETRCLAESGGSHIFVLQLDLDKTREIPRLAGYLADTRRGEELFLEAHPLAPGKLARWAVRRMSRAALSTARLASSDFPLPPRPAGRPQLVSR